MTEKKQTIALVTGASSGIGRAIALRLARDGFYVLAHFNQNEPGAEKTVNEICAAGGIADRIRFDVRKSSEVEAALDDFFKNRAEGKALGALVNNAGIHIDGLAGMMSDSAFNDVIQANLYGPFYLMRWSVRRMIRQRFGTMVNIASLAGQTGNAGQINYAASKAALIAMTKTLSSEVGSRNIRVNAVAPGFIETEMLTGLPIEEIKARIPLRRLGTSEEVAGVVSFLCSADASYITGHTISVNGGLFPS